MIARNVNQTLSERCVFFYKLIESKLCLKLGPHGFPHGCVDHMVPHKAMCLRNPRIVRISHGQYPSTGPTTCPCRSCRIILQMPHSHSLWKEHLPLAEFTYNKNFQSSVQMALYEALYGQKCQTPLCWTELSERKILGPKMVQKSEGKIKLIHDRLKVASNRQKSYADLKKKDIEYIVGD
ncbi:Transposon Ty3-G Gag-Pol polyprotein [Gossypium australe]|uniref:Transposon Ty3-G Gag-Pol polyprotein n=1 Tax=Gossypium australe TaxID=47621 RepID=A0A5B6V7L3_9ROSI|nr:Transposon Ty3-G Gag-Pol polyprotein [Gossypium australe]